MASNCFDVFERHARPVCTHLQIRKNFSACLFVCLFLDPPNRRRQGLQKSPSCLFEFRSLRQEQLANKLQTTRHVQTITTDFPAPGLAFLYQVSPLWLLKSLYLLVSCPTEYLTSIIDIRVKHKENKVKSKNTSRVICIKYKYLIAHLCAFFF